MKLWIVLHTHNHGCDVWPLFQDDPPSREEMIAQCTNWEEEVDDEVEAVGPFDMPSLLGLRHAYFLHLDGKEFRRQRHALIGLCSELDTALRTDARNDGLALVPLSRNDLELFDGLVNLTDAIADQAHDQYGIDCLLMEGEFE
jgi:hypothetical protein